MNWLQRIESFASFICQCLSPEMYTSGAISDESVWILSRFNSILIEQIEGGFVVQLYGIWFLISIVTLLRNNAIWFGNIYFGARVSVSMYYALPKLISSNEPNHLIEYRNNRIIEYEKEEHGFSIEKQPWKRLCATIATATSMTT